MGVEDDDDVSVEIGGSDGGCRSNVCTVAVTKGSVRSELHLVMVSRAGPSSRRRSSGGSW